MSKERIAKVKEFVMTEDVKKDRARIAKDFTKGAKLVVSAKYYGEIKGKPLASVLYNGEVIFTKDKEGNELNLLGDVLSKEQIESENARTAKLDEYLNNIEKKEGKTKKIAEGTCEDTRLSDESKAKILKMEAPSKGILLQKSSEQYA